MDSVASELLELAWNELGTALLNRKHPFRTATLATVADGLPAARIVTLRHAHENQVGCHVDARSPKAREVLETGQAAWLFYSFPHKLQVRISGPTRLHREDEIARAAWERSLLLSRRCYLAPLAPSAECEPEFGNMPPGLEEREPTEEESEMGFANFAVLRTAAAIIDVLSLNYSGGTRCRFENGIATWLAP